jgi:two-component system autoinducer 2 sensor kinase/phosphatase LuxQ
MGENAMNEVSTARPSGIDLAAEALSWFASWPDGLVIADCECRVVYVSAKAAEILGWITSEVQGRHLHTLLCPEDRDSAHHAETCPLCESDLDADAVHSSFWLSRSGVNVSVDYRVIPSDSGGRILSFYNNRVRPHSYREMAKFTDYVECSPAPIAEFDADGQLQYGNPALQEQLLLHGFDERGVARIWPAELTALCRRAWHRRSVINDVEVRVDDSWYRWHFHPLSGGDQPAVLAYLFDVSEEKIAQIRLAGEKAAARRDFFAKMVHELRTPLNAIIAFSQVLAQRLDGALSERDKASLRAIRIAGLQMHELVSDTLDVAKLDAGKMSVDDNEFSLATLFDSFHEQVVALAEAKHLTYQRECDPDLVVHSDFRKTQQILLNLIANAIKYTRAGSVIARGLLESGTLVLEVRDTGIGIPEEQRNKLFRSYEQVSSERHKDIHGTGLGLALVAELVALLGGTIEVASEVDQGSLFRVVLPLQLEAAGDD